MPKPIEIFRAGTHAAMSGAVLSFSESDLEATVAAYNPALHEAPLVVGHPRHDAPAYGWASALSRDGASLYATPSQVEPAFADMVAEGRFKRVSASFYTPDSKQNPVPGVFYLRHIGFLGAQPPAVKGLKPVEFSEAGEGDIVTVEFSEAQRWGWQALAAFLRSLRERWIERDGIESADNLLPAYLIEDVVRAGESEREPEPLPSPDFSETTTKTDPHEEATMPPDNDDRSADFAERETALNEKAQDLQRREDELKARIRSGVEIDAAQFAEQLAGDGRILPRQQAGVAALLVELSETSLQFGEGEEAYKGGAGEFLRAFLGGLPPQVDYGERTAHEDELSDTAQFAAPNGYTVDPGTLELHNKALAYQRRHDVDYETAVQAVGG